MTIAIDRDAAVALDRASTFAFPDDTFSMPRRNPSSAVRAESYLVGHSLGLRSRFSVERVMESLEAWGEFAVEGHFEGEGRPHSWLPYHEEATHPLARLTGGLPNEVVMMNSLTANIHFLFHALYRPEGERRAILMEGGTFPSDNYAVQTHVERRGLDSKADIIKVLPRVGEHTLRQGDIINAINTHGDKIALVFLSAVQFVSGQVLDIKALTKAAHAKGCLICFDLAHAMGNIPLSLHEDGPDGAVFCGYKYLCAGPGNGGGVWLHERHATDPNLPQLAGWWSNDPATRFKMLEQFVPKLTAERMAVSNPPIQSMASAIGGLEAYELAASQNGGDFSAMWNRQRELCRFLRATVEAIHERMPLVFEIITPEAENEHGAMLSVFLREPKADEIEDALCSEGFKVDARGAHVIRISAIPLWVTAEQIHRFGQKFNEILAATAVK